MATPKKRTDWIARTIDEKARVITLQPMHQGPEDDKPTAVGLAVTFDPTKASAANRAYAELHGWSARIGDVMAQDAGTSIADKLAAARKIVDHYESGSEEWNLRTARTKVDPEAMLADFLANNPDKLAEILAAAQAKRDNATG